MGGEEVLRLCVFTSSQGGFQQSLELCVSTPSQGGFQSLSLDSSLFFFLLYPVTSLIVLFFFSLSLCDYRLSCFVSSLFRLSPFLSFLPCSSYYLSLYSYTPCLQCRPQVITKAMQAFLHQVLIRDSELGWWVVMR